MRIETYNFGTLFMYSSKPDVNAAGDVVAYLEQKQSNGEYRTVGRIMDQGKASLHTYFDIDKHGNKANSGTYYVKVVNKKTGKWDRSDQSFTLVVEEEEEEREEEISVPNKNYQACDRSLGTKKENGQYACYGTWDYGNDFGGDNDMCGSYGSGTTGCEISAPVCDSNVAKAMQHYKISSQSDEMVTKLAELFHVNIPSLKDGMKEVWRYECVAPGSVLGASISTDPYITITTPNGGETLAAGTPIEIMWDSVGTSEISLALYKDNKWMEWIKKDMILAEASLGSYQWIPTNETLAKADTNGAVLKIYVTARKTDGTGYVDDKSDDTFSLVDNFTYTIQQLTFAVQGLASAMQK